MLDNEFFIIPHEAKYILYSPLKGIVSYINKELKILLENRKDPYIRKNKYLIDFLRKNGLDKGKSIRIPKPKFEPLGVTLFLTSKCNLGCTYCYADSGKVNSNLKIKTAKIAIDLILKNYLKKNREFPMAVNFHGGGEPTLNWDVLKECVEYIRNLENKYKIKTFLGIGTNLTQDEEKLGWLINNLDFFNVSYDLLPNYQDFNRPFLSGKGSHKIVRNNLIKLSNSKHKNKFVIRSTVTSEMIPNMKKGLKYIDRSFACKKVHIEHVEPCGRSLHNQNYPLFKQKLDECKSLSDYKFKIVGAFKEGFFPSLYFCGHQNQINFCVTPNGYVSYCFEITEKTCTHSDVFIYGKIDNKVKIDKEKFQYLAQRNTFNLKECQKCFAKWICAGSCPIKVLRQTGNIYNTKGYSKCNLIKSNLKNKLLEQLDQNSINY